MSILVKGDDVRSKTKANGTAGYGTGVNGLITFFVRLNAADSIMCKPVSHVRHFEVSFLKLNAWDLKRSILRDGGEVK